jgi:hypothetical protein
LDAIVNSSYFRSSKRYPGFLRFVVEEELSGRGAELKERTIGIEVFGREITYDTNEDPIVRVTAGEVRKRLTQYYAEPRHSTELKIHFHRGSYVPNFQKGTKELTGEPIERLTTVADSRVPLPIPIVLASPNFRST